MDDLEDLFTIRLDGNKLQLYLKDVSQKIATNKGALQNIESQVGRNRAQLNEIGELRRKVIKVTDRMQSVDKENAEKVKKLEAIDERLPEELMGRIKRDLDQQISTSVRVNQMHDEINSMAKTVEANSKVSNMLQTEFDEYHKSTDHEIHHIKDYIDQQLGYVREKTNLIEKTRNENVGLKNTIQELTNKVSWLMKMVEENNMQAMRATAITGSEYGYGPGITPRTHNRSIRHQDAEDLNLLATPKGGGRRLGDRGTSGGSGSSGGDFLNSPDAFVDGLRSNTSGVDCKDEGGDDRKARNGDGNNGSSSEHDKDQNNSNNAGNDNNANANANATESSDSGSTSNGNDNNYNDNDDDTSATNDKGGGGNDDNTDNSNNDVDSDNMSTVENVRQKFSDGLMKAVAAGYGQSETRDSKDAAAASGVKRDETKEEQGVGEGGIASADQSSGSDTETKQSQKQLDQIRELQHMRSRRQQRLEQRNRRSSVPVNILSMDFRHHPEGESGDGLGPRPIAVPEEMKQELIDSALKIVASKYEKQLNSTHQQSKDMTARLDTLTGELSKVRKKVHSLEKENKTLKRELTDSVATAAAAIAVSNKEHMDLMSDKHYVKHDTRAKKGRISDSVRASIPQLAGRFQINIVDENHGIDAVKKVEENEGTSEYIGAQIHTSSSSGTERVLISRTAANASSDTASKMSRNENKSTHSSNETDGNGLTPHGILNSSLRDYVDLQFNDMRHRLSEVTKQIITQAGGLNASALESVSVSENVSIHKYSLHKFNAETAALPLNRNLSWQKQLAAHRRQYNQQTSALSARISKLEQSYAFIQGDELSTRLNRVRNQVKFLAQELNLGHGHVLSSLLLKGDGKDSLHKKAIPVVTKTASSGTIVGSQMLVARGQPMLVGGNDGGVYKGRQGGTVFFSSTSNNRAVPSLGTYKHTYIYASG